MAGFRIAEVMRLQTNGVYLSTHRGYLQLFVNLANVAATKTRDPRPHDLGYK